MRVVLLFTWALILGHALERPQSSVLNPGTRTHHKRDQLRQRLRPHLQTVVSLHLVVHFRAKSKKKKKTKHFRRKTNWETRAKTKKRQITNCNKDREDTLRDTQNREKKKALGNHDKKQQKEKKKKKRKNLRTPKVACLRQHSSIINTNRRQPSW